MSCFKIKKNILKKEKEKEKAKQYSWAKGAESRKQRKQNLQKRKLRKQKTWQYWVSIEYSHRSFCKMDLSQVIPTRSLVVFVLNRNSSSFSGYIYIAQFLKTTSYILDLWILIHPLVDLDVDVFIICDRHTDAEFSQLILWNIEMEWRRCFDIRYICLFVCLWLCRVWVWGRTMRTQRHASFTCFSRLAFLRASSCSQTISFNLVL